ncbi:MAG: hypothetical protein KAI70_06230, partial [Candidatus Omnitrophica bacterium]|nr:hypothetical protein [Candidatus Omnitrophota bacterium]
MFRSARNVIFIICLTMCSLSFAYEWQELKGDHFIIYYTDDKDFAKKVLYKAEKYYKQIAADLRHARHLSFWQWDNRVKIHIYPDQDSFVKTRGYPKWAHGIAEYEENAIYTFSGSYEFENATLPHEITHLMFRDFIGGKTQPWLDEAVAQRAEPEKRKRIKSAVKYVYDEGGLMSLRRLMSYNIMRESNEEIVRNYYIQTMSLVDFLIDKYGFDRFTM